MVCPEAGDTLEIQGLPPATVALNVSGPPPPALVTARLAVRLPGDCCIVEKRRMPGDTWSSGLADEIANITGTLMYVCPWLPVRLIWMVAGYPPAPMVPGFAVTVSELGVPPLSGVTPIHAGAGALAEPPLTVTENSGGVAQL